MNEKAYCVAGLRFLIVDNLGVATEIMSQYVPFLVNEDNNSPCVFTLHLVEEDVELSKDKLTNEVIHKDGIFLIKICNYQDGQVYYEFHYNDKRSASLLVNKDYDYAELKLEDYKLYGLNNAFRTLYAHVALKYQVVLFHASAVCHKGKAYLFLGKSGTGKSTHSSLWLNHVPNIELINDDVPIVRLLNGKFIVYGSPWSGKTPCYRNVNYPLGGIVRIYQAPANTITRLNKIESYAAITPSVQGDRSETWVADNLHIIETLMVQKIKVWSMECLPDANAAMMCCEAITKEQ